MTLSKKQQDNIKYGRKHREIRAQALRAFVDGQPCVRCGQGMSRSDEMDLDHSDDGKTYRGLAHSTCNRSAGGAKGAAATAALYFGKAVATGRRTEVCGQCGKPMCRRPSGHVSRCW